MLVEKPLGRRREVPRASRPGRGRGLVLQVGNNRRFDPGIAFARGSSGTRSAPLSAFKAWYCDSTYRYTMTDNLQPIRQRERAHRPPGDPKADRGATICSPTAATWSTPRGSSAARSSRSRPARRALRRVLLVRRLEFADGSFGHLDLNIAVREDFQEGFQVFGEHGSVLGADVHLPGSTSRATSSASRPATASTTAPSGADAHF